MKKIAISAAAALLLGAGAVVGMPAASADEASYLNDINSNIGANEVVVGTWLNLGYAVCNIGNLQDGTAYIYNNTDNTVDSSEAQFAAESALMFLC